MPMLSLHAITKRFGALTALNRLSFSIEDGEIFGIAGPNGAGKSTLLGVCTGLVAINEGEIVFRGEQVGGLRPHQLCRRGIAQTFQIPRIFSSLSIGENVETGAIFGRKGHWYGLGHDRERVDEVLALTGLADRRNEPSAAVDLLTRKMIMLAAALATKPSLVFLDEPLAGLNRDEIDVFTDLIRSLHNSLGICFVIVEHKVRALAELSDRIMILHFGELLCLDVPEKVIADEQVIELYLGSGAHA